MHSFSIIYTSGSGVSVPDTKDNLSICPTLPDCISPWLWNPLGATFRIFDVGVSLREVPGCYHWPIVLEQNTIVLAPEIETLWVQCINWMLICYGKKNNFQIIMFIICILYKALFFIPVRNEINYSSKGILIYYIYIYYNVFNILAMLRYDILYIIPSLACACLELQFVTKSNGCVWTCESQAHCTVWYRAPGLQRSSCICSRLCCWCHLPLGSNVATWSLGPTWSHFGSAWPRRISAVSKRTKRSRNTKWSRKQSTRRLGKFKWILTPIISHGCNGVPTVLEAILDRLPNTIKTHGI